MRNVLALLVVLMLATPVFAASKPFPRSHNFMSCAGYVRYQMRLKTGHWVTRAEAARHCQ